MKKYALKLTTVEIIALSHAVEVACWATKDRKFKGFGRIRRAHAINASEKLLSQALRQSMGKRS